LGKEIVAYLVTEGDDTTDPVVVNVSIEKTGEIAGNCLIIQYEDTKLIFDVKEILNVIVDELLTS